MSPEFESVMAAQLRAGIGSRWPEPWSRLSL